MSDRSERLKSLICANTKEVKRLHERIHETFALRNRSPNAKQEWSHACQVFHSSYDKLAFPGGYEGALERILAGDPETVEAAICFLETRPYFFRSGYMFDSILRKVKRAPLNQEQLTRLQTVIECVATWRAQKAAKQASR